MKKQSGFTLVELVITVLVIGALMVALAPVYGSLVTSQRNVYAEKHKMNNQLIGSAFLSYAANSTALGTLPLSYTGNGYTKTVYNSADGTAPGVTLLQTLTQSNISPAEINDDGTTAAAVRVYQLVTGLTQQVPLYSQSGPLSTLTFQFGAIYLTACPKGTGTCNPTPATGIPGTSPVMTAANYASWAPTGTDMAAYFISTLPVQKQMLTTTAQRLDKIRDVFLTYFRGQQVTAIAGDTTNWYPSNVASMGGANPATNQGCRDGWYPLPTGTILATVGLSPSEYGTTAWAGNVEFCRDYDPLGTKVPNAAPHYAAIRINANVSSGIAPDPVVMGNNIVLTF